MDNFQELQQKYYTNLFITGVTEKEVQQKFVEKLRKVGWYVKERVFDTTGKNQIDILAYHVKIDSWIGFEVKVPKGLMDETKALRQLIRYRNSSYKVPVTIFSYVKPLINQYDGAYETNLNAVSKRFFWRWGFGYGSTENMVIEFVNGEEKNTLHLLNLSPYYNLTMADIISNIKYISTRYWENHSDVDKIMEGF